MGVTGPFFVIAVTVYIMRMITRVTPGLRLGWDDATITLGVVIFSPTISCHMFFSLTKTGHDHLAIFPLSSRSHARRWAAFLLRPTV
jgi:hypothetical protein